MREIDKSYDAKLYESDIYRKWEESGFFNPDNLSGDQTYTIILPPPNITDKLHIGHAAVIAIEDAMIRYKRLRGFKTLWIPGTDHAAIATQNVVEKKLLKEKQLTRHDLGREKFLDEVWKFLTITQATILNQTRKMGASLDWSRLAFTLDDQRKTAVTKMFCDMYEAGAIYRGERIVNWCPRCHSTLADDEVEHQTKKAKLYWIKYGPFILATSRPETKLGDTAVAVHPDDQRYQALIGKELEIDGVLGKFMVKVVADHAVDMEFGSGAIKVTPAHSFIDNEIAQRHNLPSKKIIDEDGKMMANCGKYQGMTTLEVREAIVADMQAMGLIDHIDEDYEHSAALCYRCGTVIEPLPSKQWFVSVSKPLAKLQGKSLKEAAMAAPIQFIPERFTKKYLDWMGNLRDWCISRQIWFGHRIPVWTRGEEIYIGITEPTGDHWIQDPDTLDTWFSSGMWTFSTLGWPEKTTDLKQFHPTQMLETGYELITLWISRMIMMSLFAMGEIPFEKVYLHGMTLDENGKKMSKSKGNGVDPLDIIDTYGTDALRLSLLYGTTPGNDSRFSNEKVLSQKNFINKLWNISRFMIANINRDLIENPELPKPKTIADAWIIQEFQNTGIAITNHLDAYEFSPAIEKLMNFTWDKLANWYLEIVKVEGDKSDILEYLLVNLLKLWHPFIPFVTETIWSKLFGSILMVAPWPEFKITKEINNFSQIQEIIIAIRNARAENKVEPAKKIIAQIYCKDQALISSQQELIKRLKTGIEKIEFINKSQPKTDTIFIAIADVEIYLLGAVDGEKEAIRRKKEAENLEKLIHNLETRLANQEFVNNAPKNIIAAEQEKLANYKQELNKLTI